MLRRGYKTKYFDLNIIHTCGIINGNMVMLDLLGCHQVLIERKDEKSCM